MQPNQLTTLVQQPRNINKASVQELRKVLYQYPYFSLAYTLIAKSTYDQDPQQAQHAIQIAAVYAPDRNHLKLLLEDKLGYAKLAEDNARRPVAEEASSTGNSQPIPETPQIEFVNNYITNIYAKQAKQVTNKKSLAQINIIDNFIKQGIKFRAVTIKEMALEDVPADLTKDNVSFNDDLLTENLARVMVKQGNFERAMEIYKRLQHKFPEKGTYYSTLSEEIKRDI